jgi:ubiquinone/menaquinone biosynthesis C-methylase UbiE
MKIIKSISIFYNKLSNVGKLLLLTSIFLIVIVLSKNLFPTKEGFVIQNEKFIFKDNKDIYDDFYSNIYDFLVFSHVKNDYEISAIINKTKPSQSSVMLDIGCGTGHHVAALSQNGLSVLGVDISPSMISVAKNKYPMYEFEQGDALDLGLFSYNSITHILCLYFTIYYFPDKNIFFNNCMNWLKPGGYLIIHLVDREKFDPILPPGNPLHIVSPQKYAKERITHTKVTFNDFKYESNFKLEPENNIAIFEEKFKFNDGNTRKQDQKLYMENISDIINMAQNTGFIFHAKIDLLKCSYENQFLYIFVKPGG